jgi:hypothetical protein
VTVFSNANGNFAFATANCPAGKIAVGGGARVSGLVTSGGADGTGPHLNASSPTMSGAAATGWEASALASAAYNNQFGVSAYVICVNQ